MAVKILFFLLALTQLHGDEWQRVYLATYPRSGNHWMRYLIEEATNMATGSVYLDKIPPHLPDPFPWGGYSAKHGYEGNRRYPEQNDIVVIKTHFPAVQTSLFDGQPYKKVIRIVRHPLDTFYAQHVRDQHPSPPKQIPEENLNRYISDWANFQNHWNSQENVYTVRYEDLYRNPKVVLKKILENIGYKVSKEDIERAIAKFPPEQDPVKKLQFYSKSDKTLIKHGLKKQMKQFSYEI